MRVKPDATAPLWVCHLGEQLSAGRGELHVCPGLMQPEPARCNRAFDSGAVLIRRATGLEECAVDQLREPIISSSWTTVADSASVRSCPAGYRFLALRGLRARSFSTRRLAIARGDQFFLQLQPFVGRHNLLPRRLPIADRAELRQGDVIDLFVVTDSVVDWLKAWEEEWTTCTGWDECHLGALDYIRVSGTRGGYHEQSKNSLIVDLKDGRTALWPFVL